MKIKKKELLEVIDSHGELIGADGIPQNGADLESQASKTTDYNVKVSTQPFRYDMLGRFGFTLLPFFESEEKGGEKNELLQKLTDLMHERFVDILGHYYRNPKELKPHFRQESEGKKAAGSEKFDEEWAKKILATIRPFLDKELKALDENIREELDENAFFEGKLVEKLVGEKSEEELAKKSDDKEVREKKIEKIAGLINKLEKKDIDKIINLLEIEKNG